MAHNKNPFRRGSKRHIIAEHYFQGDSLSWTFKKCSDRLGENGFKFEKNTGQGKREELPMFQQRNALRRTIESVFDQLGREAENRKARQDGFEERQREGGGGGQDDGQGEQGDGEGQDGEGSEGEGDGQEQQESQNGSKSKKNGNGELDYLEEVRRLRQWCRDRALNGAQIDAISMRPVVFGKRMIAAGIPPEAALYAMTMHWPDDIASDAGVPKFNPKRLYKKRSDQKHGLIDYVVKLMQARVPVMLIGPYGSSKSTIAEQAAGEIGVQYRECPLTAGATPSWLLGRNDRDGYKESGLVHIVRNGGVFNFEEMDASDPNMLLVVNQLLAQGRLDNPVTGENVQAHDEFYPVATANTYGLGANRDFTGRERLDAATIDRWRMGRVYVDIDESLEDRIWAA